MSIRPYIVDVSLERPTPELLAEWADEDERNDAEFSEFDTMIRCRLPWASKGNGIVHDIMMDDFAWDNDRLCGLLLVFANEEFKRRVPADGEYISIREPRGEAFAELRGRSFYVTHDGAEELSGEFAVDAVRKRHGEELDDLHCFLYVEADAYIERCIEEADGGKELLGGRFPLYTDITAALLHATDLLKVTYARLSETATVVERRIREAIAKEVAK
jgi:hypothetical protein